MSFAPHRPSRRGPCGPATKGAALLLLAATALGAPGCHLVTPFAVESERDVDGGADAHLDSGPDGSSDGDVTTDADVTQGSGPLVLAGRGAKLVAERVCDVDGDGTADNAVAELGADMSELFVLAVNAGLATSVGDGQVFVAHFKWVDDLAGPSSAGTSLALYAGEDTDRPLDPSDDLDGEEPFYIDANDLDQSGEPRITIDDVVIDNGAVSRSGGAFTLSFADGAGQLEVAELTGTLAPAGARIDVRFCGHVAIDAVGDGAAQVEELGDLTFLELLLAGGAAFGTMSIPGITPDVDLDGDGIEHFVLDDDGRIEQCIDGDRTVIVGRECWRDPRIADAFSLVLEFEGVGARFGGREPAWEYQVPVDPDSWPVPEGFFSTLPDRDGACAALGEGCDPFSSSPCCDTAHRCSGADTQSYRCLAQCVPSRCLHGPGLLGPCLLTEHADEPLCWALATRPDQVACEPGTFGCTTQLGISENTVCIDRDLEATCSERCTTPSAPCGEAGHCVPMAFEATGVCVDD